MDKGRAFAASSGVGEQGLTPSGDVRGDAGALARAAALAAPVSLASQHTLPVDAALAELFPSGLRRGSALAVVGDAAVSMALATAAAATASGSWLAVVGLPAIGLGAATGLGVALDRFVVVDLGSAAQRERRARSDASAVLGMVIDGFDVVIARVPRSLPPATWRRALARARERGGVVLVIDPPPALEVAATVTTTGRWIGLEDGAGRLLTRSVMATVGGRGAMARTRRSMLLLPGANGAAQLVTGATAAAPARDAPLLDEPLRSVG